MNYNNISNYFYQKYNRELRKEKPLVHFVYCTNKFQNYKTTNYLISFLIIYRKLTIYICVGTSLMLSAAPNKICNFYYLSSRPTGVGREQSVKYHDPCFFSTFTTLFFIHAYIEANNSINIKKSTQTQCTEKMK